MLTGARSRRAISHLTVLCGYLILTVALTYPVAFHLTSHVPFAHQFPGWPEGDLDPWHSLWVLWFASHSLIERGHLPLFTDTLFYPRGVSLAYMRLIPLPLLVSVPLVSLFGVIAAHNLLILGSLAFGGYATFLLTDDLVHDKRAAFLAGLVYAFCPYHMARSTVHLFLVTGAVWLPLYALLLIKALREGKMVHLLLAPLLFFMTLLSNPYYPIFLLVFAGICLLYHLWQPWPTITKKVLLQRFALIAALSMLLALLVVVPALQREWSDTLLHMPLSDARSWSADLLAFIIPSPFHSLWGSAVQPIYGRFTGNVFEQTVYIGYVVLGLALMTFVACKSREVRFWAIAAGTFFLLALGPFLHVYGTYAVQADDVPLSLPLPSLLLHFVPVLKGVRVPSRFAVMLMLCLAVLVGCGVKTLLDRPGNGHRRMWAQAGLLGGLSVAILVDFLSVPLPMLNATVPQVYETIARDGHADGSLGDVPLKRGTARYQYYQTAHRKNLLTGFGPRLPFSLVEYAGTFPLMSLLRDPDRFLDQRSRWTREDALRLIDFFNLDAVVIHREYLHPPTVGPLTQFLTDTFPVRQMVTEGNFVVLWVARDDNPQAHWQQADYRWDFGPSETPPFIAEGWSIPETWGEMTVAWSNAEESRLWVYFPRSVAGVMELRLLPFVFPESPPQTVKIYVNQQLLTEIELAGNFWQSHSVRLPQAALRAGINSIRLVYRYIASPAQVTVGSPDRRALAVAYDFIAFRFE